MKKLLILLILILTPFLADARALMMTSGGVAAAGTTYPDITMWLNFEANDTADPYTMGASDCGFDTTGTFVSGATIAGTGCKVGTYCLSLPSGNDAMTFTMPAMTKGRIGFWYYMTTWANSVPILKWYVDASNYFFLRSSTSDELQIRWTIGASNETETISSTLTLVVGAWRFIEVAWDTSLGVTDYIDVYVDGTRYINDVGALTGLGASTLQIGDIAENADLDSFYDNFIVSNDPTRDLYESGTGLSVAITKPSGACP
jgi:hypothetical protein